MFKKSFAAIALAVLAVIAVPTAANANGYAPATNITVTGDVAPGGIVVVNFANNTFIAGESVSFTLTGENATGATLASFKAVVNSQSLVKTASGEGAVALDVTLPTNASGTYTTTATGLTSGTVGYDAPMLAIWAAAGALLLGIALMVVLTVVRRQRANA
jgi:hypothetical protein